MTKAAEKRFEDAIEKSVAIAGKIFDTLPDRADTQIALFAIVRGAVLAVCGIAQFTGRNRTVDAREKFKQTVIDHVRATLNEILDGDTGKPFNDPDGETKH